MRRFRERQWSRRWWRPRRLVLRPGLLWLDRPGGVLDPPGSSPVGTHGAVAWARNPGQVRVVQPLLSRTGKPGLVVHLLDGSPIFLFGPEPGKRC